MAWRSFLLKLSGRDRSILNRLARHHGVSATQVLRWSLRCFAALTDGRVDSDSSLSEILSHLTPPRRPRQKARD